MFWSLIFGSDNYQPTEKEIEFDNLIDRCTELRKQVEAKNALNLDTSAEMAEWKANLIKLDNLKSKL